MSIVVIGSSNTDMIIQVPRIPKPGETILGGKFSMAAGGKGANQAVAAARAGGTVTFIARVGKDMFGDKALAGFEKDNIDTRYIVQDAEAPSGIAEIFVADDGENSIAVASGANMNLSPEDVSAAEEIITTADIVLMQLETPLKTMRHAAEMAHRAGVPVILNPAPAQPLDDEFLKTISILTPNETEAELLTGIEVTDENSARKAADALLGKGLESVIITLGAKGAFIVKKSGSTMVPGFSVKAVDTTAAGDVFNGALAVSIANDLDLAQCVRFSSAAAAISVTKLGAQTSAPGREEILQFLKKQGVS